MKASKFVLILIFCLFFLHKSRALFKNDEPVHFMDPGEWVDNDRPGLRIFCHNAKAKNIIHLWKTITMNLRTTLESYDVYEGSTPHEVIEKHEDNQRYWRFSLFGSKKSKNFQLNPFVDSCIGVYMHKNKNQYQYRLIMSTNVVDSWRFTMMAAGTILFWYAQKMSHNTLFYYLSGVLIGVFLSVVILIYFCGKILPGGRFVYLMMASGYAMSFYLAQMLWDNVQVITMQYREWVMYYIISTSLLSFIICYRFGPITNSRTKNIIQWILQAAALATVYYSSYFREASMFFCIVLLVFYNIPMFFIQKGRKYWKQMFPEDRKLLTDDEFRKEGIRETQKALSGLKEYCSSPKCNSWKTVLRLKDPIRFAKFMEGESHLSENESMLHDAELSQLIDECDYTDDEDQDDSLL